MEGDFLWRKNARVQFRRNFGTRQGPHQSSTPASTSNQGCQQPVYQEQIRHIEQCHGLVP